MSGPGEHGAWREQVAAAVIERRPPDPELAAHLAACAECADLWRTLGGTSARLIAAARALPLEAAPPAHLRERVLAAAAPETRRDRSVPTPVRRVWLGRLAWGAGGAVLGAAAVLALVVVGGPRAEPSRITLTGTELAPDAWGWATVERRADGNVHVRLAIAGLPRSGQDDYYELWMVGEDGRMSAGTFRSDGTQVDRIFTTAADPAHYPRMGITLEPDDGDPAPSDQRVASSG